MPPKRKRKKRKGRKKKRGIEANRSSGSEAVASSAPESSAPEVDANLDQGDDAAAQASSAPGLASGAIRYDTEYSITLNTKPPYGIKLLADKQLTINYNVLGLLRTHSI